MNNALKSSYRFIIKSKAFTLINLIGLVLGLTTSFFLLAFTINETSFNHHLVKDHTIIRWIFQDRRGTITAEAPIPLKDSLRSYSRILETSGRLINANMMTGTIGIIRNGEYTDEPGFWCIDPAIFSIFKITLIEHSGSGSFPEADEIFISSSAAKRHFHDMNPIGTVLDIQTAGLTFHMKITGLFEDQPWNTTFRPDIIASMDFLFNYLKLLDTSMDSIISSMHDYHAETYSIVREGTTTYALDSLTQLVQDKLGFAHAQIAVSYQPIQDIYLHSDTFIGNSQLKGNKDSILIFTSLAFFILLLAGINYSILSMARSALRYKEVGVRKVLGASVADLRSQMLLESILLTFIAFPLALLLMGLLDPIISNLAGYRLQLHRINLWKYLMLFGIITIFIGFLSGINVSAFLASMQPLMALKAKLYPHKKFHFSKVFIIFQLFITISLLIGVVTVLRQLWYCKHRNPGFDPNNLMIVQTNRSEFPQYDSLYNYIAGVPGIISLSAASISPPDDIAFIDKLKSAQNQRQEIMLERIIVDCNYFSTLGVKILKGYEFTRDSFNANKIVINESMERIMDMERAIGAKISGFTIIGVVEDFNVHSLRKPVYPTIFMFHPPSTLSMMIRCESGKGDSVLDAVKQGWSRYANGLPPKIYHYQDALNKVYSREQNFSLIVCIMTLLAFIVTGMGLFGLAILISERRVKETAIRKVFGASDMNIMFGMQREFLIFIWIASLFAVPVIAVVMNKWLHSFHYHVTAGWYVYLGAIIGILLYVSLVLFLRMYKILKQNPVIALKYE